LRGNPKRFADIHVSDGIHYPTLLTGEWCPFSLTATSFWSEIAEEVGVDLVIVSIESDEGARLKASIHATGVPCLIVAPDVTVYGVQHNRHEAKKLLQSLANNG
jgi:glutaredoxin